MPRAAPGCGVVPFGVYMVLVLGSPLVAVAIGAFQSPAAAFTLHNLRSPRTASTARLQLTSLELAVIASVLPGILGLLIAYAI